MFERGEQREYTSTSQGNITRNITNWNNLSHGIIKGGELIEHNNMLIRVKVSSNDHKYGIISKNPSLKGIEIFIKEYLILEYQVELRNKF